MPKRNDVIHDNHFRKHWQERVKCWFDQPARKKRRRLARTAKAARIFPRPVQGSLRPVVHPPTIKYNAKVRLGRGFTLEELKEAGINRHLALSIGIALDHRRRNKSDKSFRTNVQRLKEYKSKLVLFPRGKKVRASEASKEDQAKAQQQTGVLFPIRARSNKLEVAKKTDIDSKTSAYAALRKARSDARLVGIREKRKKEKAEAAATEGKAKATGGEGEKVAKEPAKKEAKKAGGK